MAEKTYLVGVFLDQLNEEGYPETYIVKEPSHMQTTDTLVFKFVFVHTRNTPKPLMSKKPLGFAIGPHSSSVQTNIPLLKVTVP